MVNNQRVIKLDKCLGTISKLFRDELKLPPNIDCGLVILIRGLPGTGKTTLALQLAHYLPKLFCPSSPKNRSVYLSLDQNPGALESKLRSMLQSQIKQNKKMGIKDKSVRAGKPFVNFKPEKEKALSGEIPLLSENFEKGFSVLSNLLSDTNSLFGNKPKGKGSVLIIDGLSSIPKSQRLILGVDRIFDRMRQLAKVSIIVYEPDNNAEENHLDYMTDMVIQLRETQLKDSSEYLINEMHILKARYQNPARGWHQYKIRDWGLEFFPSLHFQVHQQNYMPNTYANSLASLKDIQVPEQNQKTANEKDPESKNIDNKQISIIEGIVGEISNGSNIALLGGRGCFKTKLCLDFLFAGARLENQEHGLLISLIDNFENLSEKMPCLGRCENPSGCTKTSKESCKKCIHLFHQRPGCITPAEFLYYIIERLDYLDNDKKDKDRIKRLAFWDFTQIDYRFPIFLDNKMFIPALMDTFKFKTSYMKSEKQYGKNSPIVRDLKSVLMGAGNARYTKAVSAIADNVIFCWRAVHDGEKVSAKSESAAHLENILIELKLEPDINSITSWLLLYVDRREKPVTTGIHNLYAFPIVNGQLGLPGYIWEPGKFAISAPSIFIDAEEAIKKIHQQQGFE